MTTSPALAVHGLSKSYRGRPAVRALDVELRSGEIHGLLGPNGAGKTTLLRMLLGLVEPDAGPISLLGRPAGTASGPARGGVAGFVEAPRFYPYLSGRRNLRLLTRLDDALAVSESMEGRIDDVLRQAGLARDADVAVGGYSAGMRQRLGLASALLRRPRLLLLDEPTSALDPAGALALREDLRRLAQEGVTILLSSHDMAEVADLCAAVTIVDRGRVVFSGTKDELLAKAPRAVHRLVTSDDAAARAVASRHPEVELTAASDGALDLSADEGALDAYVMALGQSGIAVRSLEGRDRSLDAIYFRLTGGETSVAESPALPRSAAARERPRASLGGVRAAAAAELAKLAAQVKVWATLGACLLGPLAFGVALKVQSSLPEDTLFGRSARASGFAVPLVVLAFATAWALPILTSVVAGDLFASEDRYGTWSTLLTRSRTRGELFLGKVLAGLVFSIAVVATLGASSLACGVLLVGQQPLLGLSGILFGRHRAWRLVVEAWAAVLPPTFGFTGIAMVTSVATRSSVAGIAVPTIAALAMQLSTFVNGPEVVRRALLSSPFGAWHGLLADPPFYRPLLEGTAVSAVYFVGGVAAAYVLFRRRDFGG